MNTNRLGVGEQGSAWELPDGVAPGFTPTPAVPPLNDAPPERLKKLGGVTVVVESHRAHQNVAELHARVRADH